MPANKPEEVDQLVGEAISKGDIEAAVALYEPDATFVPEPGQTVTGTAAIREVMTNFVAMKPNLQVEVPLVVSSGEVAILYSKWTLSRHRRRRQSRGRVRAGPRSGAFAG